MIHRLLFLFGTTFLAQALGSLKYFELVYCLMSTLAISTHTWHCGKLLRFSLHVPRNGKFPWAPA